MTQNEQILDWFKEHKYINRQNAMRNLSPPIWNLPARIHDLREEGYIIETVKMKKGKNYSKYELVGKYGTKENDSQNDCR